MKLRIFLIVVLLFFLHRNSVSDDLQLKVDKKVCNFGEIQEGQTALVTFNLLNPGTKIIAIKEVRTFGACIELKPLKNRELAPGDSLELNYIFESIGYGGVPIDKKIEVHYNDSKVLKLRLKGVVLPLKKYQAPFGEMIYNYFALIDIRSRQSFLNEHLLGAIHVPHSELIDWVMQISKNLSKETIIYLYCDDGKKSDAVAQKLQNSGFAQFVSLVGGLREWKKQYGDKLLVSGER